MPRHTFKQKLLKSVEEEANRYNYQIPVKLHFALTELIESGVDRMTSLELLSSRHQEEATTNLRKLIEYLVNEDRSGNTSNMIDPETFHSARINNYTFGPFW